MSRKQVAEESCQVPVWIVTFSDMTTNLLTFFVLLVSMAHIRDETLFDLNEANRFLQAVKIGFGFKIETNFDAKKTKYYIKDEDKWFTGRTIDAKEENIRRVFKEVNRSMKAIPSEIVAEKTNFAVTNISFSQGRSELNESAKKFLTQFAMNLPQDAGSDEVKLYVLGLARDEQTEKGQWALSAMRAQTVADFLKDILSSQPRCAIYSWGAGPGGCWVARDGPVSEQSQILIAVLRAND